MIHPDSPRTLDIEYNEEAFIISILSLIPLDMRFAAEKDIRLMLDERGKAHRPEVDARVSCLEDALRPFAQLADTMYTLNDSDKMYGIHVANYRYAAKMLSASSPQKPTVEDYKAADHAMFVALARRCGWSEYSSRPMPCFLEDAVKAYEK